MKKFNTIIMDSPIAWQIGFQNPATPVMEGIIWLHNYIFMYLIIVFTVVLWFLFRSLFLFRKSRNPEPMEFNHDPVIEVIWTISPAFILIAIAIPSFSLLYSMDDIIDPALTVKAIGHQWYWSYELDVSRTDYILDYFDFTKFLGNEKVTKDASLIKLEKKLGLEFLKFKKHAFYKLLSKKIVVKTKPKFIEINDIIYNSKSILPPLPADKKLTSEALSSIRLFDIIYRFNKIVTTETMSDRQLLTYFLPLKSMLGSLVLPDKPLLSWILPLKSQIALENKIAEAHRALPPLLFQLIHDNYQFNEAYAQKHWGSFYLFKFNFFTKNTLIRQSLTLVSPQIKFDSYMIPEADLPFGGLRLLEVDNRLILPIRTNIRVMVTSMDVIHSWAVPSFGIKLDAIPGRLNQTGLYIKRTGVFYGQCSELCGVNHAFMPIVVEAVTFDKFNQWVNLKGNPSKLSDLTGATEYEIRIK